MTTAFEGSIMSAATWFFIGLFVGWTPAVIMVLILLARASEARK
jgi:hypothetical protein